MDDEQSKSGDHSPSDLDSAQIKLLAEENGLAFTKVQIADVPIEGDNVLSIYQFYEYIDSKRGNELEDVLDVLIDRPETELENKSLVPNSEELPFFASKTRVESFDADNIFDQLEGI
jgi:hypothetical protein